MPDSPLPQPGEGWTRLLERRALLVTGKGGVGRTVVTGAIATAAAAAGKRVLIAEIGEASRQRRSTLARVFGRELLEDAPAPVAPGIDGITLSSEQGTEAFLSSVLRVRAIARLALRTPVLLRLLHAAPSFHEMGIFYHFLTQLQATDRSGAPAYDLVLLDMPATGHTLALTGLPRILLSLVDRGPIADALRDGQRILNDPTQSGALVVTLPEPHPVTEALELIDGLHGTDMPVAAVVANRVPTDRPTADERAAMERILGGQDMLGAVALSRLDRALPCVAQLGERSGAPLLILPETGPPGGSRKDQVSALAQLLTSQRSTP